MPRLIRSALARRGLRLVPTGGEVNESVSGKGVRKRKRRRRLAILTSLALVVSTSAAIAQSGSPSPEDPAGDLPVNPEWLANTLNRASTTAEVKNNTIPGAIRRRNQATKNWRTAQR